VTPFVAYPVSRPVLAWRVGTSLVWFAGFGLAVLGTAVWAVTLGRLWTWYPQDGPIVHEYRRARPWGPWRHVCLERQDCLVLDPRLPGFVPPRVSCP
jgi:hypothetical protein